MRALGNAGNIGQFALIALPYLFRRSLVDDPIGCLGIHTGIDQFGLRHLEWCARCQISLNHQYLPLLGSDCFDV